MLLTVRDLRTIVRLAKKRRAGETLRTIKNFGEAPVGDFGGGRGLLEQCAEESESVLDLSTIICLQRDDPRTPPPNHPCALR